MNWNGEKRRASDNGKEDVVSILVRIDERLAGHLKNFEEHKRDFHSHKEDDTKNFAVLNRALWISIGAIGILEIVLRLSGK